MGLNEKEFLQIENLLKKFKTGIEGYLNHLNT